MAIPDIATLLARLTAPTETLLLSKIGTGSLATLPTSLFTTSAAAPGVPPAPAANPTTATACSRTTTGAAGQNNGGTPTLRALHSVLSSAGGMMLADRLSHQGGLDGTVTTAQTTNLPTAALTRYTTGIGVQMALEIYTQIGTTGTTATVSYTNQAGTAGQISDPVVIGGTSFREAGRLISVPLLAGDTGVKAVASVTIAASTGTAGAIGVVLFKPLYPLHTMNPDALNEFNLFFQGGGILPEILDDACLFFVYMTVLSNVSGCVYLSED